MGLGLLCNRVNALSNSLRLNNLRLLGIVFTRVDARLKLTKRTIAQMREEAKEFNAYVFETQIPKNIKLAEAPESSLPIILYAPTSRGANAFNKLTIEFMQRIGADHE